MKILVINLGSTSTKLALYEGEDELCKKNIKHSREDIARFPVWTEQLDWRLEQVLAFLKEENTKPMELSCIVSRGGSPPGIRAGATKVDKKLADALLNRALEPHPASLGPVIALRIADAVGIPAYVYDPITSDELDPLARLYGVKGIEHNSMCHFLNTHAMGIRLAERLGKDFSEISIIAAHIGGGNSICIWKKGHPTDVVPGDACTFSAERAGFMRSERMVQLVEEYGAAACTKWLHGEGGFVSLMGTNDLREVEAAITAGDEFALYCEQAMAYQLSKCMCSLLPAADGHADAFLLTGGGAYWERLAADVEKRLAFLNIPFYVMAGEDEMLALAKGAVRVMLGKEEVKKYEG